jgi:hypothetical protein
MTREQEYVFMIGEAVDRQRPTEKHRKREEQDPFPGMRWRGVGREKESREASQPSRGSKEKGASTKPTATAASESR